MTKKEELIGYLEKIDSNNSQACIKLFHDYENDFLSVCGSYSNHHSWQGGFIDHILETMQIGEIMYSRFSLWRTLPFSINDFILCLFLHDLEKVWKYSSDNAFKKELSSFQNYHEFIFSICEKYHISLSQKHKNAIQYAHGEGEDWSPKKRIMCELAAFVHSCDVLSARIWYDYPKN